MSKATSSWKPSRSIEECHEILNGPGQFHESERVIIAGAVYRVYKNLWPSVRKFWLTSVTNKPALHSREYIVFEGSRMTYGQADELVQRAASVFREVYGIRKGDRVGLAMRNFPEWIISFFAVSMLGAVPTLFNAWLPEEGFLNCIHLTMPKLIILDIERLKLLSPHLDTLAISVLVVRHNSSSFRGSLGVNDWNKALSAYSGSLKSWEQEPEIHPDDDAAIFFTSGTTGFNKAVLSSQRAFLGAFFNNTYAIRRRELRRGQDLPPPFGRAPMPSTPPKPSVLLIAMPLFHVIGCTSQLIAGTASGGKIVLIRKWDKANAASLMVKEKVTSFAGVPTLILDLIETGFAGNENIASLVLGGAPAADTLPKEIREKFPNVMVQQGYGAAETNSLAVSILGEDYMEKPGSIGLPLGVVDILIVDPNTNKILPVGQIGELWIRGPGVMRRYFNNPMATAETLTRDGWYKSGDLASMDEEGFVYIKDRVKDMIIRGGENVHSAIVENAFFADVRVLECAVVGIPDRRLGELVGAVIVPRKEWSGRLDDKDVLQTVKPRLPTYAVPCMALIQETPLERNAAGKVLKPGLRKMVAREWERRKASAVKGKL